MAKKMSNAKREWKLNWHKARVNYRYCESRYDVREHSDILYKRNFFDEFGFTKKDWEKVSRGEEI